MGRLCVPQLPSNHVPNALLWPTSSYAVEYSNLRPNIALSNYHTSVTKSICTPFTSIGSIPRYHHFGVLQIGSDEFATLDFEKYFQSKLSPDTTEKQIMDEEIEKRTTDEEDGLDGCHGYSGSSGSFGDLKVRRRRRRKHGNKGRIPWNKGLKHTAETRALIKQRTIEALRDPKVRKKMSEHPLAHSDKNKAKISASLKRLWGKRLKWTRLKEKFFLSWAKSVATAAKKGGSDQKELEWDSYEKIKQEVAIQQLQCTADKATAKELAEEKKLERAQAKAKKIARFAQKKREREKEEKAKAREETKRKAHKKSMKTVKELSVSNELGLKQRLTMIMQRKSIDSQLIIHGKPSTYHSPAWEKFDVELIKRQKVKREVPLAEQIQAARSKRMESLAREALAVPSTVCLVRNHLEQSSEWDLMQQQQKKEPWKER